MISELNASIRNVLEGDNIMNGPVLRHRSRNELTAMDNLSSLLHLQIDPETMRNYAHDIFFHL